MEETDGVSEESAMTEDIQSIPVENPEELPDTNEELQPFMAPLRGPMSGGSYTLGNGNSFPGLNEAMDAASDGDTITVTGELTETQAVSVVKDITLIAGNDTAKINFTDNAGLIVDSGKTLTLGSGGTEPVLQITSNEGNVTNSIAVNVTNGHLIFQAGVRLEDKGVVLDGGTAQGTFTGGEIRIGHSSKPYMAILVKNGARIDTISGGVYKGSDHALNINGAGSTIGIISGGEFSHEKNKASYSAVVVKGGGRINTISGGTFTSLTRAGVEVYNGGWIDEISGGLYQASEANTAMLVQTARVKLISGGKFFCGGDIAGAKSLDVNSKAQIDKITGGLYWGKINIESGCTSLEPDLNGERGEARYWGHGNWDRYVIGEYHHDPITNEGEHVVYPKYTVDGKTFSYFPSTYSGTVHFWEFEPKDHLNQKEWLLFDKNHKGTAFFKEKEGYFNWSGSDMEGYVKKSIYTLEKPYYEETFEENSAYQGKKFIFLQQRPALSFNANSPLPGVAPTGSAPYTRYIRPYRSNDMGTKIAWEEEYGQWEQVFEVPGNPGNLALAGYKFKGWNTQADGKGLNLREGKFYLMPLKDVTLYAQWEPAGVKITYDPNGGVFRGSTGLTSEAHLIGEKMTIAEAATRSGYKFLYWEGSKYFPGDTYEVVGDHTFTAVWEKETPGLRPSGIRVTTPSNQYFVTISEAPTQKRITNLPATGSHDSYLSALGLLAIGLILILKKR